MAGVSRRALLRGLAGGVAGPLLLRAAPAVTVAPLTAACTRDRGTVQIAVVWSGRELEMFRSVLDTWSDRPPIQLISAGNGIGSLLRSRIAASNPPHIAVLSQLRMFEEFRGHLRPLDDEVSEIHTPEWWWRELTDRRTPYGVWLKAAHKSVFWHRLRGRFSAEGYQPETLHMLAADLKSLAGWGRLGIGAADGWVLTDWFENALLAISQDVYDGLAAGQDLWGAAEVGETLGWLGDVWRTDGVPPGDPRQTLLTQYDEAAIRALGRHPGPGVTFEGDFIGPAIAPYQEKGLVDRRLGTFRFPPLSSGGAKPLIVGGDFAVRFSDDGSARDVIEWLASREAARRFAEHGFLTVHKGADTAKYLSELPDGVPDDSNLPHLFAELAGELREPADSEVRFDLSDQLTGDLAGGDGQGIWRLLQEFFDDVTGSGANLDRAVERTQRALVKASRKARG